MSTKVEQESTIEPPHVQTMFTAKASAASASSPKISMFARKSGFVIPKNKLSGSLVPIFKGGSKPGAGDAANDESSKQVQRKTQWGPDLTQDAGVRKGRALAYQIRLEQITKQLNSEILETEDNQDSQLPIQNSESSVPHAKGEKPEQLKLERREIIGEILKLNPSFKAPPDYRPLLKETKVPVPVKEYPGYNFIGLIFGSTGETQKQLEKKSGAKIRAYGIRKDTGEKVEINPSDGNATHGTYKEVYIQIIADSYEKIDAAFAPIELLITTVSANPPPVAATTSTSAPVDNVSGVEQSQSASTSFTIPPVVVQQETAQSTFGSAQNPQGNHQPYPGPWFQSGQPRPPMGPPSGFIPRPNLSPPVFGSPSQAQSAPFNASSQFVPRLGLPAGYGSSQNPSFAPPRPQPNLQRPFMPQSPFGQLGAPRNPHGPTYQPTPNRPSISGRPPLPGNLPMFSGESPRPLGPPLSQNERPLIPSGSAAQWSISPTPGGMVRMAPPQPPPGPRPATSQPINSSGGPQPSISTNMGSHGTFASGPHPQSGYPPSSTFFPNQVPEPTSAPGSFQSSSPIAPLQQLQMPQANPASNAFLRPIPVASPSSGASFTPLNQSALTAPRPHSSSNDFTFQPQRPSNMSSSPRGQFLGIQQTTQNTRPQNSTGQPSLTPQSHSFPPPSNFSSSEPPSQGFSRPQLSNQMNQMRSEIPPPFIGNQNANVRPPSFANPGPGSFAPQLGPRNPSPAPYMSHIRGPFPPRPGSTQLQQNYPGGASGQPRHFLAPGQQQPGGNVSGRPAYAPGEQHQTYDPFSPTSASSTVSIQRSNPSKMTQESDPEYEDLMASVGVK